jgi:hypothetical protein
VSKKPAQFDVVDGQPRIRAICEFCDGKYGLPKDTEAIDGNPVSGLKYEELPFDLRIKWDTYNLDVVVMDDLMFAKPQLWQKDTSRIDGVSAATDAMARAMLSVPESVYRIDEIHHGYSAPSFARLDTNFRISSMFPSKEKT